YPKVGTGNSAVRAGVVSANGGATTWLQIPDDPAQNYLPRMEWTGPNELMLQRMNRLQNTDRVMLADAITGATRTILTEHDSAWVDVVDDVTWIAKGAEFLWTSERDGWRHVYRVSRDGKRITNISPGAFDVVTVAGVDEAGGWLYYIASPDNATQRYLYRMKLDGKGSAVRVSPAAAVGTHTYRISPDAHFAFHTYSHFDSPSVTELVELPSHRVVRTRVAVWGWSGGGSSTLQAMFRYPDVYQVGMSVAPVPDERLYDTIYQERYMGLLQTAADSARYNRASPINQAQGLKGRLLVVHG